MNFYPVTRFLVTPLLVIVTALLCLVTPPIVWAVQWGAGWRGGRINEVFFFYKKMYGKSAKTSGRNNEVTVLRRWP